MSNQQRILTLLQHLDSGDITDLEYQELLALLSLSESSLNQAKSRFERKATDAVRNLERSRKINKRNYQRMYMWIGSAAAAILLLLAVLQLIPREISFETHTGEIREITLPDGSDISMNEESRLSYYRSSFNNKKREVQFSGEGFFRIKKDTHALFRILSPLGMTTVLGTTFYLSDDTETKSGSIDLVEGKISFTGPDRHPVLLETGEMIAIQPQSVLKIASNPNYRYWKTGYLDFQDVELFEVIHQLEEILQIEITVDGESPGCRLDSEFSDESPDEILSVIAIAFGGEAEKTGENSFFIRDLNCN